MDATGFTVVYAGCFAVGMDGIVPAHACSVAAAMPHFHVSTCMLQVEMQPLGINLPHIVKVGFYRTHVIGSNECFVLCTRKGVAFRELSTHQLLCGPL